jgi:hypothetical protein
LNSRALRWLGWVTFAGMSAALAAAGVWLLFTTFQLYDDEGYVLYSLKNYGEHGQLYDRVFSQYGPFFFAFYDALHRMLGFAWTSTSARIITLVHWILTAGCCGALAWRFTRSVTATAFVGGGVFTFIWIMINEPIHPGGPIGFFVAAAALIGAWRDPARSVPGAAIVGAIGAALALTKINVGAFLLFSSAAWIVLHLDFPTWRKRLLALLTLWFVAMPWILMNKMLREEPVRTFALISSLAAIGWAAGMARTRAGSGAGFRPALSFLAGAAGVTVVTVAVTLSRGTSLSGLIHGVLLDPLNQPNVYSFPVPWQPGALVVNVAALALTLWAAWRPTDPAVVPAVVAARLVAAVLFALEILQVGSFRSPAHFAISYGIGLAAVCAFPLRRDDAGREDARVRGWLATVLLLQALHAYPVAGSQLYWATFLWMPLFVLALRDAALAWPAAWRVPARLLPLVGVVAGWFFGGYMTYRLVDVAWAKRPVGERLGLPGAETIQPTDDRAFGLRIMAENAKAHGDLLYSLPGLYSFNLWTGLPTPTLDNATQWFLSLSDERQAAIRDKLRADPRSVLIVQKDTLQFLVDHGFRVRGPLGEALGTEFQKAFEVDGYAFWVKKGRTVAPLSTGRASAGGAAGRTRLDLVLAAPKQPVARIELVQLGSVPRASLTTLTPANATLRATPLDGAGDPTDPETPNAWSSAFAAPIVRLTAEFTGKVEQPGQVLATVFAADGTRLAAVRILP